MTVSCIKTCDHPAKGGNIKKGNRIRSVLSFIYFELSLILILIYRYYGTWAEIGVHSIILNNYSF